MNTFFSTTLTLFFIMDAVGIIPTYLGLVKNYSPKKQLLIAIRELLIALAVMFIFYFIGKGLLNLLSVSRGTLRISGGIIFFLIAIRLIFPNTDHPRGKWDGASPFIVPIATPLIAGPSLLAAIMIFSQEDGPAALGPMVVAWLLSTVILLCARPIYNLIGDKGLSAFERLMGLILTLVAVQMIILGSRDLIQSVINK